MNKAAYGRPLFVTLAIVSMLVLIAGTVVAKEQQLAGVHLNDHAIDLLDIYGPPDGVVTGPPGSPFPEVGLMAGAGMPGMLGAGMPGAGMPGAGMPGAGMPGAGMPMGGMAGAAGMPRPGMAGPATAGPRGPLMPGGAAAGPMTAQPMGPGGVPVAGAGAFPGAPGGAAGVGQAQAAGVPNWALPVWIETRAGEMMWMYQRGPITIGFLLDLDGYVQDIAVAADKCNYARTADWQPHKYVKLGDHYSRVLQRYGWPDETNTYTVSGLGGGAAAPSVSFSGTSMTFSRDCVLRYSENGNNIDFTLHNFRVVRIHIWD